MIKFYELFLAIDAVIFREPSIDVYGLLLPKGLIPIISETVIWNRSHV